MFGGPGKGIPGLLCYDSLMTKGRNRQVTLLTCIFLCFATLAVYWQVWDFEFVAVDDHLYVTGNPAVLAGLSPQTIRWAATGIGAGNWHPLTWISLMVDSDIARFATWLFDVDFGRDNSGVYHLTNVALHLANVLLLFILLHQVTHHRWRSVFVALLFAIHPTRVESVAWVSERKDVLSTLFWLLTMMAYVRYVESPGFTRYALVGLLLALGLMSKPMLVTVPIVLLLMDYWPLQRLRIDNYWSLVREKAALFAMALVSSVITFLVQRIEGAVVPMDFIGIGPRIVNALVSYVRYIGKMIWPVNLASFYPLPQSGPPLWQGVAAAVALGVATYVAIRVARRRKYVLVGWLWYLVTMIPVIGIVQVGGQAMADRYTYVPYIGLFIAIVWGLAEALPLHRWRSGVWAAAFCGTIAVAVLASASYRQVSLWRDEISIWKHTIAVTGPNPRAHYNLGCAYSVRGMFDEAAEQYRLAIKIDPHRYDALNNLGFVMIQKDKPAEAEKYLRRALKLNPNFFDAHNNLGLALGLQGRIDEAIAHFRAALKIRPHDEKARANLETALARKGIFGSR
ncbi:MAG: tetratricopeptide repeat protein [Armatimonadetes bacterium]|nr:tetratricopeptide repeat protein [Armatimonadota bacterium]